MSVILAAPFIHPWIAAGGVLLGALPIIIHLLNRRRFREVTWAAMDFLLAANRRTARRIRIEQVLLLATRVLLMVIAGVAVSRPYLTASPIAAAGTGRTHRLILLDNSASMQAAGPSGETNFERAKGLAQRLLDSFPAGDGVSLVLLSRPTSAVIERPGYDRSMVSSALASVRVSQAGTDMLAGLQSAKSILSASDAAPGNRVVYILSDHTDSCWPSAGQGQAPGGALAADIARDGRLIVVTCGLDRPVNLAITSLEPVAGLIRPDMPSRWSATIANFGKTESGNVSVEVLHDGRLVRTEAVASLPAGGSKTIQFRLHVSEPGQSCVQLVLRQPKPDALPLDDCRSFVVTALGHLPVLLVDGKPGPSRFVGETGYLATAMAPKLQATEKTWITPKSITDLEFPAEALDEYRLIVLCNVRRLEAALWRRLLAYVNGGGAVWFFLGDQISTEHYNRYGFAGGKGVFPARLSTLVGQGRQSEEFHRLRIPQPPHPVLADLTGQATSGLFLARVFRYVKATPASEPPLARVLLSYETGDPAIVARPVGAGHVLCCTTSANMAWNNLPAKGDFVSLVMEMITYLVPSASRNQNVLVGAPLRLPITARQSSLPIQLIRPDGSTTPVGVRRAGLQFTTDHASARQAGLYQFRIADDRLLAAAHLDRSESDLRSLSRSELTDRLQSDFQYVEKPEVLADGSIDLGHREFATLLFGVLFVLLLVETLMAMFFGHHHAKAS